MRANYQVTRESIRELELQIFELQSQLVALRRSLGETPIDDYLLQTLNGGRRLSDYFGRHDTLLVIHNMGKSCPHCTAYADGLGGILSHLRSRVSVLLVSPDSPDVQAAFASSRGWGFELGSVRGTTLSHDLGFEPKAGEYWPGFAVIRKAETGSLVLVCRDDFEPGDRYSPLWHILGMVRGEYHDWDLENPTVNAGNAGL
jgi:predicted dithiol-disulfide oxidoreductase (DUF899 family)